MSNPNTQSVYVEIENVNEEATIISNQNIEFEDFIENEVNELIYEKINEQN